MNNENGNPGGTSGVTSERRMDQIKDSVKGLVDQGQEKVHQLKDRVIEAKQEAVSRGNQYLDRASEMIKAHPFKAVALAFGVGYVGMRLFRR
jgi:ElaB/YqjD/DUF883 family membrane-anchored ribosome-binding protein